MIVLINVLHTTAKDIMLLKAIARTGLITDNLLHCFGITERRIYANIKNNNILKKGPYMLFGNLTYIYILSDSAKNALYSNYRINIYKTDLTQIEHDYVLSRIYASMPPLVQESWITEGNLKSLYPNSDSTTDAMVNVNGLRVGIEVITDSYSTEQINAKKAFISKYCDDFIMVHTRRNIHYTI